jgi:hypothetical protein
MHLVFIGSCMQAMRIARAPAPPHTTTSNPHPCSSPSSSQNNPSKLNGGGVPGAFAFDEKKHLGVAVHSQKPKNAQKPKNTFHQK